MIAEHGDQHGELIQLPLGGPHRAELARAVCANSFHLLEPFRSAVEHIERLSPKRFDYAAGQDLPNPGYDVTCEITSYSLLGAWESDLPSVDPELSPELWMRSWRKL